MKKATFGLVAVGAVIALRPVLKRRMLRKIQEHCQQMATKCKQMMAASSPECAHCAGMPEHRHETAARLRDDEQTATPREHEKEEPQFVGASKAVATA